MRLAQVKGKTEASNHLHKPLFFRLNNIGDREKFNELIEGDNVVFVHDDIESQLRELVKIRNPHKRFTDEEYNGLIASHMGNIPAADYGVWVYFPWAMRLVHLLDEVEFIEVRTSRNQQKITREEQQTLSQKKIGIIGLSVGQSIALTLAMERTCGQLRLADFDTAELSNLNRIRAGVQNLGVKKVVMAAREIAEIDPFLDVQIFDEGLQEHNIDAFFSGDGNLDLLIEVCDGLDMKIISRYKAREMGIPVVMDTNDRGMLDVERFDLEPSRPILHGYAGNLSPENIKTITEPERLGYILKMVGAATLSPRMKASMLELGQTIGTWPQLASSVVLGGAITTDVCRRILLDQFHESGRYYVDMDHIVADRKAPAGDESIHFNTELLIPAGPESRSGEELPVDVLMPEKTYIDELVDFAKEHNVFKRFPFIIRRQDDRLTVTQSGEVPEHMHVCILGGMIASFNHKLLNDGRQEEASVAFADAENGFFEIIFRPAAKKAVVPLPEIGLREKLQQKGITINWSSDKAAALDTLAETERLSHFAPDQHRLMYNYISFSPEHEGLSYEKTGLPPMARPVYLMASDPEAIVFTGEWNKGMALYQLAKMRMGQYEHIGVVEADTDNFDALLYIGETFQALLWESDSDKISINDTLLGLYKIKDFPEIYTEIHLLKKESFITIFKANLKRGVFIVFA